MHKQAIVVRTDLKMSCGKTAAQCCHASLEAALKANKKILNAWRAEGAKKVVLKVDSEAELIELQSLAAQAKLPTSLITDAGLTELPARTKTALGIGPDKEEKIDKISGKLATL